MPCRSLAVSSFLYHFLTTEPYSPSIIRIAKHIGTRTKTPTSWTGKLIGCSIRRRTVVGSPPTVRPSTSHKRWLLVGVTAHRFRGLHRHCDEAGRDPVAFTLDFSRDATLFRGFSGAGKTSRMSAICWCLTGYGHRSQGLPSPLHIPINIQVAGDDDTGTNAGFELPAIVPIPTETELLAVDGKRRPTHGFASSFDRWRMAARWRSNVVSNGTARKTTR